MSQPSLARLHDAHKHFGKIAALDGFSFEVNRGELVSQFLPRISASGADRRPGFLATDSICRRFRCKPALPTRVHVRFARLFQGCGASADGAAQ